MTPDQKEASTPPPDPEQTPSRQAGKALEELYPWGYRSQDNEP